MSKKRVLGLFRKTTAFSLVVALLVSMLVGAGTTTAYAASKTVKFVSSSNGTTGNQTIKGPQNMGTLDSTAATTYWYAGNGFYGMKRNAVEFGEKYDASDWLLVDTDAMWGGEYLFSTWGNAYKEDGSDLYTVSDDATAIGQTNTVYYQKILTYGERLWSEYGNTWFTGKEAEAVGTATVTTTNNSYRTFEDYVSGTTTSNNSYSYWVGAATADDIASGNYEITTVKKWYESGSTDTTKYLPLTAPIAATTYENAVKDYIGSSLYNGITEDELDVKGSNIYAILDAHLYAPSVSELEANEKVYKKIIKNVYADYTAEANNTGGWGPNGGWFSAGKSSPTVYNPTAHLYDLTRTDLWSRSFSGLHVYDTALDAWNVNVDGDLGSNDYLAFSQAVAPAFNLDTSSVVMARSAQASTTPSSSLASYNPNNLGSNVVFSLESDALNLVTGLSNKNLNNVVPGQTYEIAYSGASTTGEARNSASAAKFYVSAAIYNDKNEIVYYGQLGEVGKNGTGTVTLTMPAGLQAGVQYKLALFEEQINGSYTTTTPSDKSITTYATSYVSPMNVATFTLDGLTATANNGAVLTEETTYEVEDIADLITVTSKTQGTLVFGTDYTLKSVTGDAKVSGATFTTGDNGSKNAKQLTFEIGYLDEDRSVVPNTTVTLSVKSKSAVDDETYQNDQASEADEDGFYAWRDTASGITWKYKTNEAGQITFLYTTNDPSRLIDAAGTLNLPKSVAGLTVVGIGGGTEDKPVVSMGDGNWTGISFPESVTSINDYAFANSRHAANIVIPKTVTYIGAKAFYKSNIASVKLNEMTGQVGYLAFGKCENLTNVNIKGRVLVINEEAFSDSGIENLSLSGIVTLRSGAFRNCTGITSLYLPNGVDAAAEAFSGCSGLKTLEVNMSVLANDTFADCTAIETLILDGNVVKVAYNWNGQNSTVAREIYVKNGNTKFEFYTSGNTYYSAYGTSGNVRVIYDEGTDEGTNLNASNGVLTALTKTLASHSSAYHDFYTGLSSGVTFVYNGAKSTEQIMEESGVSDVNIVSDVQTGIEVAFDGVLLTTQEINKDKMSVIALYGNAEGYSYNPEHFYVIRSEEFNSLSRNNGVTEAAVAAFEPLTANASDLQNGLSATVVVFKSISDVEGKAEYSDIEDAGYFYATVSVRVEEYTDKDYVEEAYGSYTAILEEINGLNGDISSMEESMKSIIANINAALGTNFDVDAENLVDEYEAAVRALSDELSRAATEKSDNIAEVKALITSVNATYGSNIELPDNATTEQINAAISEALQTIRGDQKEKSDAILSLKVQYVNIAQLLSDYMSDTENLEADAVNGTTIEDIKRAISSALADLNSANKEISDIDSALDGLYLALADALGNMTMTTDDMEVSAADKLDSITSMINTLTSSYETNNDYLRSCIAEIDIAFGYGEYVKFNDKYVFMIFPDGVFYVKDSETGAKTYLQTEDNRNFTEAADQSAYAKYDTVDGAKYLYLEDTVNGWQPYQSNPLSSYKNAMAALMGGLGTYSEQSQVLIETVNTICGYAEGDAGYISIPNNATAEEMNAAMNSALNSVNGTLQNLNAQNAVYAMQYAEAAGALDEFLENDYGEAVTSENAQEITLAVRKAVSALTTLRTEMDAINSALASLYDVLAYAFDNMGLYAPGTLDGEDETAADKINSISGMIALITESYNVLNEDYKALEGEYQSILDFVYGEDEKTVNQVTAAQVKDQIEKNKQAEIDKAVEKALEDAGTLNADATTVQNSIAETIDAIMDGEDVSTTGMTDALVEALAAVQDMKATVTSMQATVDGYTSVLSTIQSALGLGDTATAAEIIAAIQALKDRVNELSQQVTTLSEENASLTAQLANGTYKDGYDAGFKAGEASVDKTADIKKSYDEGYQKGYEEGLAKNNATSSESYTKGYNEGYSAGLKQTNLTSGESYNKGYTEGFTAGASSVSSSSSSASYSRGYREGFNAGVNSVDVSYSGSDVYDKGYDAGYAAGVKSVDTSANGEVYTNGYNAGYIKGYTEGTTKASGATSTEQVLDLTAQVATLTTERNLFEDQVLTLNGEVEALESRVTTLTNANQTLTNKVTTLNAKIDKLETDLEAANNELSVLKEATKDSGEDVGTPAPEATPTPGITESPEDIDLNNSFIAISTTKYTLGTAVETTMPSKALVDATNESQVAETELVQRFDTGNLQLATNADACVAGSAEQSLKASNILSYYMNHLDELGDLGSKEIKDAMTDATATVKFDVLSTFDVQANEAQRQAMEQGENVNLMVKSDEITDGELYFAIHESDMREGAYDVMLVTAENDCVTLNLPDLSPITLVKVSISKTPVMEPEPDTSTPEPGVTDDPTITTAPEDDGNTNNDEGKDGNFDTMPDDNQDEGSGIVGIIAVFVVLIVAVAIAVVLLLMAKQKKGNMSKR